MPNTECFENPFWRALIKGKVGEWEVFVSLYKACLDRSVNVCVFTAAVDSIGIDALVIIDGLIIPLAVQARGERIHLKQGDSSLETVAKQHQIVAISPCRESGQVYVACHERILSALKEGRASIALNQCVKLQDWISQLQSSKPQ